MTYSRSEYGRNTLNFKDIIIGFLKRFVSLLSVHVVVFVLAAALTLTDSFGIENVRPYYMPLLIAAGVGAAVTPVTYFFFFGSAVKYDSSRLGDFDRNLIYRRFGGRYASALKNAVIDMHLFDFNNALESLKAILEKPLNDAQKSVLYFYLGRCYQLMGYPSNGTKYFEEAIEVGLELDDTYLLAARCMVQNGRFDDAIAYYNKLIERESYFDFIYTDTGIAYLKKGDGEKALEYFNKSIEEGKNYSFALGGCSLAYLQLKNLDKSEEYYKKAVQCNMDDVNGFKIFYCNIAESVDMLDKINPNMKQKQENHDDFQHKTV